MKLLKAIIHNFRGIHEQEIAFRGYSLLVGPNNAGKSTVIDAIRAFYEKDGFKFRLDDDFPHSGTQDNESWAELTYLLSDEEWESLADAYRVPSKELRVRKFFRTEAKTHDNKPAAGFIFGYKEDGELSNEAFYGAKNVQSGKLGDLIYIPAISKVEEHAKLSGPSALRDLLNDVMGDVVGSGQAYGTFNDSLQAFANSVKEEQTSDGRSLSGFEEELNKLIVDWQAQFKLTFPTPSAAEIVKSIAKWNIIDEVLDKPQDIDLFGSGFQRYFIYCLVQLGAGYVGKKPSKKQKDFVPELNLVLFEEPEAFLHPPQQEQLARSLGALARAKNWQVLSATHSPHFVSRNAADIPAIVRLRRTLGEVQAFQIRQSNWDALVDANQILNSIASNYPALAAKLHTDDAKPDMEAIKYFIWLNPDRSGAFFADHVLLVEGPTEVALINRMIDEDKITGASPGLYVMDCIGKFNIHRFMNVFSLLGIPHSVLHDDDGDKDYHAEINQLIEDSRDTQFTLAVQRIHGKLEDLLALPSPGADHRKPQHALYCYECGRIDDGKLKDFCALVEGCTGGKCS